MFTLAHLSDSHLPPVPWPRLAELSPKQALGLINWHGKRKQMHRRDILDAVVADLLAQRPDHIAVGGDLVNIGLPGEIEAARLWLEQLGEPERVTVVPGNHDVHGAARTNHGADTLRSLDPWRPYMTGPGAGPCAGFPFVRRFGQIALVALSSAVPTPIFWASGRLGQAQRQALAADLRSLSDGGCFRIVLLHHPPLPGQADRRRGLEDARELAEILQSCGADLVLHGHNHRSTLLWLDGVSGRIPVVGVASASAAGPTDGGQGRYQAGRFHLFEIRNRARGWQLGFTARGIGPAGVMAELEHINLTP